MLMCNQHFPLSADSHSTCMVLIIYQYLLYVLLILLFPCIVHQNCLFEYSSVSNGIFDVTAFANPYGFRIMESLRALWSCKCVPTINKTDKDQRDPPPKKKKNITETEQDCRYKIGNIHIFQW
jgi:hypothetical protein